MKTYTTDEMIKEITDDPNKKFEVEMFKGKKNDDTVELFDGSLIWSWSMDVVELSYDVLNYTWTEVKEPVTFIEAVKSGKRMRVDHPYVNKHILPDKYYSLSYILNALMKIGVCEDDIRYLLTDSEWYIE